jgi:hypothetical protein
MEPRRRAQGPKADLLTTDFSLSSYFPLLFCEADWNGLACLGWLELPSGIQFWDPNDPIIPRTFIKQMHMVTALVYVNLGAPIAAKTFESPFSRFRIALTPLNCCP